ncbi:DEAD/DEAH box helicase [Fimbriimonas ginsengisoli]|uniref:ATP-dependent RNA helicase RhlE n=1 Tax=Fimbriimonas ginsengisoli Gsoil 348 TaxID=661478 RepID=A0A068NWN0_FIMGI|nr:DEAD/DEAH box helicase [Fimbriimonas ginsengisoli]AIE87170.1 ATP-dependent RNA helicase RhlE [Fimbriimonas ginsengisoli Gsoil 348]
MTAKTTESTTSFADLGLSARTLTAVTREGFTQPTPIQQAAIPAGLSGRDVIGIAQTGTGKTLAFGLPMLERVLNDGVGLVLAPTRELALQIEETLRRVGSSFGIRTAVLIGGAPMGRQISLLRSRPHVIIATPGRLLDHLTQNTIRLDQVSVAVLDEADRMLDMGFLPAIRKILLRVPAKRQTMLFSATMPPEIAKLANEFQQNAIRVEVAPAGTTAELVDQELHLVPQIDKLSFLEKLLGDNSGTILVFARTRHGAKKVAKQVRLMGHSAAELHSDRTLAQRKAALEGFKHGTYRVLVATDIAARGIDVKQISVVVNFDLPDQPEDYIHRIGRTGRAGETGRAITIATPEQVGEVRRIERLIGRHLLPSSVRPAESAHGHFGANRGPSNRFPRPRAPQAQRRTPQTARR